MGLFSFGRKRGESRDRSRGERREAALAREAAAADARAGAEAARERGRRRSVGQETMLDPTLPEKQRARRRLVGAIALALLAVVVLPMLLDSHPKPVANDIAVTIPARPHSESRQRDVDARALTEAAAPDNPPASGSANTTPATPATAGAGGQARPGSRPDAQASARPEARVAETGAAPRPAPAPVERPAVAVPQPRGAGSPAAPDTGGSRFVVQLGAFNDEGAGRAWEGKVKALGVPAYLEKQGARFMLRAGPFDSRETARAAVAKVRGAGLTASH